MRQARTVGRAPGRWSARPFRRTVRAAAFAAAVLIAGCDFMGYGPGNLQPGATAEEVRRQMGKPTEERQLADGGRVFWYVRGPQGFHTYKVVFDRDAKVTSIAQVLTEANFRNIVADRSTRADVLELIGPPRESMKFPNLAEEVSTWRYQDGTFNKYLHVHFTPDGVVKRYVLEMETVSP